MDNVEAAKHDVRVVMAALLPLLGVAASLSQPLVFLSGLAVAVVVAQIANVLFTYWRTRALKLSIGACITGLIVGLLTSGSLIGTAVAAFLAITSKHILRIRPHQLFNPAAFGVFVTALFIPSAQTWWVTGAPLWLMALVGLVVTLHFQRIDETLTYLAATTVLTFALTQNVSALMAALTAGAIFFGSIMVIEPLSNPTSKKGRLVFAIIVAIGGAILGLYVPAVAVLGGLLIGNALAPLLSKIK